MNEPEHILSVQNELGEGPVWAVDEQALYWVDIQRDCFYRFYPTTGRQERFDTGLPIGCLALRASGGLVLATKKGFAYCHSPGDRIEFFLDPEPDRPHNRFNDGAVDRQGRFWAGTMCTGTPEDCQNSPGTFYRLATDGSLSVIIEGVRVPNGTGWSPDNRTMYFTDSGRRTIYAYDFEPETGKMEKGRPFVQTPEGVVPDGLTVDSEGFVWSAVWGGWQIIRYDPAGNVDREIKLPVQYPTSCAFGGPQLDELYITTAATRLSPAERKQQPLAGDLFRLRPGVKGLEEPKFLG